MAETTISWCTTVWNPVTGCTRVGGEDSGCWNCYAARFAHRFDHPGDKFDGLTTIRNGRVDWSGHVRSHPERLEQPLRWRKPRRVFVNSMSDLFHPKVPFEFIAAVFGVAAACPDHQFLILTKRPQRMVEWFKWLEKETERRVYYNPADPCVFEAGVAMNRDEFRTPVVEWPLSNVFVGISAENQQTLEERWQYLAQVPAAVRWISLEPLLDPINLHLACCVHANEAHPEQKFSNVCSNPPDWVVVGGESGPRACPCSIEWIRSIVKQCQEAGTPVHVKQLGSRPFRSLNMPAMIDGRECFAVGHFITDSKGAVMEDWPPDLQVREWPEVGNA